MTQNMIDKLNEFLRGERSAVETYELALKKVQAGELSNALRQLRDAHDERVAMIRATIVESGGQPAEGSGAWGAFAKAIQAGADLLGDATAIAALEEGEDRGMKMYSNAQAIQDPIVRELITVTLIPAQKKSHDLCRTLKRHMKAA
jgi:hypothetical protein